MSTNKSELGKKIKKYRKKLGISQDTLSKKASLRYTKLFAVFFNFLSKFRFIC
jgi:DNA-binding XRE family transcriptional regulator